MSIDVFKEWPPFYNYALILARRFEMNLLQIDSQYVVSPPLCRPSFTISFDTFLLFMESHIALLYVHSVRKQSGFF